MTWSVLLIAAMLSNADLMIENKARWDTEIHDGFEFHYWEDNFRNKLGIIRLIKVLALLSHVIVNVIFMCYNFRTLPIRDPLERLNQAKHIVTWFEFPIKFFQCHCVVVFACISVYSAFLRSVNGEGYVRLVECLRLLASYSVLKAIPRANPINAFSDVSKAKHVGGDVHHFSERWKKALACGLFKTFGAINGFTIYATLTEAQEKRKDEKT